MGELAHRLPPDCQTAARPRVFWWPDAFGWRGWRFGALRRSLSRSSHRVEHLLCADFVIIPHGPSAEVDDDALRQRLLTIFRSVHFRNSSRARYLMLAPCDHGSGDCIAFHRQLPPMIREAVAPSSATRHLGFLTTAASPRHFFVRGVDIRLPHDEAHHCGPYCGLSARERWGGRPVRPVGAMRVAAQAQLRALSPWNRGEATDAMLRRPRRWTLFWSGSVTERTERYALWRHHHGRDRFQIQVTSGACTSCCDGSPPRSQAFDRHTMPAMMAQSDFCAVPPGQDDGDSDRQIAAVLYACIPVFLSGGDETLPLEEVLPWDAISVRLSARQIPELHHILSAISPARVIAMRRRMRDVWPSLLWPSRAPSTPPLVDSQSDPPLADDAFAAFMRLLRRRLGDGLAPLGAPLGVAAPADAARASQIERWEAAHAERRPPAGLTGKALAEARARKPPKAWACVRQRQQRQWWVANASSMAHNSQRLR